ncbi:hypothetical protein [Ruegeria halocynthiae]|uniref:hypothetical protein n=1 Tax=Ruegeria halocynthiae TaxID=985054 RepID=UPI000565C500|nr:hypothetical protein [Ruegeria halocynthiae]
MTIYSPNNERKRVFLASVQNLEASAEDVFALICPTRRYEWDANWNCDLVRSDSGVAEYKAVFTVEDDEREMGGTWVVTRYDANERIHFFRMNADRVTESNWSVFTNPNGGSTLHVEITESGLTDAGDAQVGAITDETFVEWVGGAAKLIDARAAKSDADRYAPNRQADGSFAAAKDLAALVVSADAHATVPREALHSMFSPVREYEWEPKWYCQYAHNYSRDMEQGEIHQVTDPFFADFGTWATIRCDRPERLTHMRINDDRVTIYDWTFTPAADGGTDLHWELTDIGLNEEVAPHILVMKPDHLAKVWQKVADQWSTYVTTGKPMEIDDSNYVGMPVYDPDTGEAMTFEKLKSIYIKHLQDTGQM